MENQNQTTAVTTTPYMQQNVTRKQAAGISVLATVGVLVMAKLGRMGYGAVRTAMAERQSGSGAKATP